LRGAGGYGRLMKSRRCFMLFFSQGAMAVILGMSALFQCRITGNAGGISDPTDLLPIDNDVSGFLRKGSTAIMNDQQSIYAAIDGQAEVYIDYGFTEGVMQRFSNGNIDIEVEIFNQSNENNAKGIFERFYPTSPELISQKNPIVVIDHSLASQYQMQYARQNIFMRIISMNEKSDFALNMVKQFYYNIDKKIGTSE
jgi:hypothetical protein